MKTRPAILVSIIGVLTAASPARNCAAYDLPQSLPGYGTGCLAQTCLGTQTKTLPGHTASESSNIDTSVVMEPRARHPDRLDGWGPLRFGMTVQETLNALDITLQTPGVNAIGPMLATGKSVEVGGIPFQESVEFLKDGKGTWRASQIALSHRVDKFDSQATGVADLRINEQDCKVEYYKIVEALSARYGSPDSAVGPNVLDEHQGQGIITKVWERFHTTFIFKSGAQINSELSIFLSRDSSSCAVSVLYNAPPVISKPEPNGHF